MGFFFLVLVVAFLAGVVGIIEEIRPILGPSIAIGLAIAGVALLGGIISGRKKK